MYGPTESTIWSSIYRVETPNGQIPIGRPIANTQVYILDRNQQVLPIGVPGELYIGGDGLAQGYLNRPELTDEKFILKPFSLTSANGFTRPAISRDGCPMAISRFSAGWTIRSRSVVFGSKLGEIEAALAQHLDVRETAVLAREDATEERHADQNGKPRTRTELSRSIENPKSDKRLSGLCCPSQGANVQ